MIDNWDGLFTGIGQLPASRLRKNHHFAFEQVDRRAQKVERLRLHQQRVESRLAQAVTELNEPPTKRVKVTEEEFRQLEAFRKIQQPPP